MFTGIIDHKGTLKQVERGSTGHRWHVACGFTDLVLGESIAVDGVCLTVTERTPEGFLCDLSGETLAVTRAGEAECGREVNLERALRMGDRLGGHLVTGHVEGTVRLRSREPHGEYLCMTFEGFTSEQRRWLLPKGSVTLNGVSLTLNTVTSETFSVMLIPHTLQITSLGALQPGDRVNVEFDWMTKVILNDVAERKKLLEVSP